MNSQTNCQAANATIGKPCAWSTNSMEWCQDVGCWDYDGTNETACESNSFGLKCDWESTSCESKQPGTECWQYDGDQTACQAVEGCVYGGCIEEGCWDATTSAQCALLTGDNGKSCLWNSQYSYCYEQGCWNYIDSGNCTANSCNWKSTYCTEYSCAEFSYINQTWCTSNIAGLNCNYDSGMKRCESQGCWNYHDSTSCAAVNTSNIKCTWKTGTGGWCQKVECYNWDNITLNGQATQTDCLGNATYYGIDCAWDDNGGWCFRNMSTTTCASFTTEKSCMDTMYCWWDSNAQICNTPNFGGGGGGGSGFTQMFMEWNPGCYIFPDQASCQNVTGCYWDSTFCEENFTIIPDGQINCTLITDSTMCDTIPALSSCCSWQAGSCLTDPMDPTCRKQMQQPPEGASYCEDYNAYSSQALCTQISGSPWYMPCTWDNSTQHCKFNSAQVFGTGTSGGGGFEQINNEINCQSAGGKWVSESYCEGNTSVTMGRCEPKFDEDRNCNKFCYACEYKNDGSNYSSLGDAKTGCESSKSGLPPNSPTDATGWCKFEAFAAQDSEGRWGKCKQKSDVKATGGLKCSNNTCGGCTFLGKIADGSAAQICEAAGCKWFTDPNNANKGWCGDKADKTCSEKCEKCYDSSSCTSKGQGGNGACSWDNAILVCKPATGSGNMELCWDGTDNDLNGKIDCSDAKCFSDPFCGGGAIMGQFGVDCFGFTTNATCTDNNCYWVNETWGAWCDMPGMQCFKNAGTNQSWCEVDAFAGTQNNTCVWHTEMGGGGHCGFDQSLPPQCMGLTEVACNASANCKWVSADWCNDGGYICDPDPVYVNANPDFYDCAQYDDNEATCNNTLGCMWQQDPWCQQQGAGAGFCDFIGFSCFEYDQSQCAENNQCFWNANQQQCDFLCNDFNFFGHNGTSGNVCTNTDYTSSLNCTWITGFCDPKGFSASGGGMMGGCKMYDSNPTGCAAQTGCSYFSQPVEQQRCDMNFSSDCQGKSWDQTTCTADPLCMWYDSKCIPAVENCNLNTTYQNTPCLSLPDGLVGDEGTKQNCTVEAQTNCTSTSNGMCWWETSQSKCQPTCFNSAITNQAQCAAAGSMCMWRQGFCGSAMEAQMFDNMEKGAPKILGTDPCQDANLEDFTDICGFGMKDMGDSWGFGIGVDNMRDSAICNGVMLSPMMGGGSGSGTTTTQFYFYLDTDGNTTNNCAANDDATLQGFEFYFKYQGSIGQTGSLTETSNSYKCVNGAWGAADLRATSQKQFMCQEIGGGVIAIPKADLNKYPTLFVPGSNFRVYVATGNATSTVSAPADTASPGFGTPNAIDFKMECCWKPGADCDGDSIVSQEDPDCENILNKGFIEYEDCLNEVDDDNNGYTDCYDLACTCEVDGCTDKPKCNNTGVNALNYTDTTAPTLKGIKTEEYTDAVLIMYDTDEPANGTLTFYNQSTTCANATAGQTDVFDSGILYTTVRAYKLWHSANLNSGTIGAALAANKTYYYKLTMCDKKGNCANSACQNFKTPASSDECYFCSFITRIQVPSGWNISYDTNRDGVYDHDQGQVCGVTAGMKTNYTDGRSVDILMSKADNSSWIKFMGATLTRTALNWRTRDIEGQNLPAGTSNNIGYAGMPAEVRDKIINNLHPEACQIKIPGTSTGLWHCNDAMTSCYEINNASGLYLNETGADYMIWNVPYCEFSVWAGGNLGAVTTSTSTTTISTGSSTPTSKTGAAAVDASEGIVRTLSVNDALVISLGDKGGGSAGGSTSHQIVVEKITSDSVTLKIYSEPIELVLKVGDKKKVDVDKDGILDILIELRSINVPKQTADIYFEDITPKKEPVPAEEEKEVEEMPQVPVTGQVVKEKPPVTPVEKASKLGRWFVLLGILALIAIVMGGYGLSGGAIRRMLQAGSQRDNIGEQNEKEK